MELESSNLIFTNNFSHLEIPLSISYKKDIKIFIKFFPSTMGVINVFIIFVLLIIFFFNEIKSFVNSLELYFLFFFSKYLLNYYQDEQNNFCDNFRNIYNKKFESSIILYNVSLKEINFEIFIWINFDYISRKILINHSYEKVATLHMLNALKYYTFKYNYKNDDIMIIDSGAYIGWYSTFFTKFKFSLLSFVPLYENYYILKKNFCRNSRDFFGNTPTIIIINEVLYPIESSCSYYKDFRALRKDIILCDKNKEKNLDNDYIKINTVQKNILNNFIPLINNKKLTLLILNLEYEGEKFLENENYLITKYHVPFIFIEFNMKMFIIHETRPQDFLKIFFQNGYKISLNGFLSRKFISIEDIMKATLSKINLYIIYVGNE